MMDIKNKKRSESAIFIAVLFGILILVNILSLRFFARGDLTKDNIFTLSQASTSLAKNLEDKLLVKAYFTKNLPGRYATLERHVRDVLEEYSQHSDGQMHVEFIDPAGDEDEEKVAQSLGIQKMPNPDIEKDQATVKEGYRGISFSYGELTEVIPAVESPVGLEYEITSVLKKLTGQQAEVGFLVGHGEPEITPKQNPNQQMMPQDPRSQGAYRNVRNNLDIYKYKQVDLKKGESPIPPETKALVIAGTKAKLEQKELYEIDQFLLRGGSVAFFVDGVNVETQQGQFPGMPVQYNTSVNEPNIRDFLEHHGVHLGRNLVMDAQSSHFPARCPPIPLSLPRPYPAWPLISAFGEEHPITYRLGSLTLPYTTTVRATKSAEEDDKREAREIAFSSGNSWAADGATAVVDPCNIVASKKLESSIPVAATVLGTFVSFFKGKELPSAKDDKGKGELDIPEASAFIEESKVPGRLMVVGSAGLPGDETLGFLARMDRRQALNNFTFVQNVLDWMTNEEDLISVRMKTVDDPPLRKASEGTKAAAKYGNIVGIPLAFVLFGLVRWRIRRSKSN
ncbi:MAG: GldG family protein [Proteobacteria bacterium]|nr:GldG family protein [Pseudomonadota bacterium]